MVILMGGLICMYAVGQDRDGASSYGRHVSGFIIERVRDSAMSRASGNATRIIIEIVRKQAGQIGLRASGVGW